MKTKLKVAVIGAGTAGLCAGRHLLAEPDKFQFDIFEQQEGLGGTWRFTDHVGVDQYGIPVHSSMYKNLSTNVPKEAMAYPDFAFKHCGGKSFIQHTEVVEYLEDFAQHFGLYEHTKFHTLIENVRPMDPSAKRIEWAVSFSDVITKEKETRTYDAVMVCSGHYSDPNLPEIKGLEDFQGTVIHSHDYREPLPFKDQRVVVLGTGASGIDIVIQVSSVAKEVMLSYNSPLLKKYPLLENVLHKKEIESADKSSVTFSGGDRYECDAVILCTGYLYSFPFVDKMCNLEVVNQRVVPLYLHMFHIDFPTMVFVGLPQLSPRQTFVQQTKVFIKFLKGLIQLPGKDEMRSHADRDFQRRAAAELGMKPKHAHVLPGPLMWEYDDELSKLGDIDPIPNSVGNLFQHALTMWGVDILNYRDANYCIVDDDTFVQVE